MLLVLLYDVVFQILKKEKPALPITKIDLKRIIATRKVSNWYRSDFNVTLFDKFVYFLGLFCTFQFQDMILSGA